MTQIQLATGIIDVNVDLPITIAFNDVTKRGSRSGGYSSTIQVDGNANNIKLLGLYFDIDLENGTFDRKKKTECSVLQDGVVVFEGYIQLLEINRINIHRRSNLKLITYTVFVFDEVANFFNEMGNKELTDLDLTDLNHVFNRDNIVASWANTDGYIYPQFAKSDPVYTVRDFKPAVFEWEYFTRIFAANGYEFEFPQAFTNGFRLDKRIVPYNGKTSNDTLLKLFAEQFEIIGEQPTYINLVAATNNPLGSFLDVSTNPTQIQSVTSGEPSLSIDVIQDAQGQYDIATDIFTNLAQSERTLNYNVKCDASITIRGVDNSNNSISWFANFLNSVVFVERVEFFCGFVVQSLTDVNKMLLLGSNNPFLVIDTNTSFPPNPVTYSTSINTIGQLGLFDHTEDYQITPIIISKAIDVNGVVSPVLNYTFVDGSNNQIHVETNIELSNLTLRVLPDLSELVPNITVPMNAFIPQKIKQRDFIQSIAKSYNLFFIADDENPSLIRVVSRDKYIDDAPQWDWSQKFAEDQDNTLSFLSNEVARGQNYLYKSDKDGINEGYQSQTARTFGDARLILENEYTKGDDNNELIYSPTPSIYASVGVTLPAINGVNPDTNIRVLLNNGIKPCLPYQFYNNLIPEGDFITLNECLHTSMFDDDNEPNFSICFDSPLFLFHPLQTSQTNNYLYNLHHKRELSTINDGSMLVGYFELTNLDIQILAKSLQYKVFIRDNGWFYINKIDKYNAGKQTLTRVELITLDDQTKLLFTKPPTVLPVANQTTNQTVQQHLAGVDLSTNIWTTQELPMIVGLYNVISGDGNIVMGNKNQIQSNNNVVMGNDNVLLNGSDGSKILGNGSRIAARANIVGGRDINREVITLDIETGTKTRTFVAAFDFVIESVTYLTTTTTETIEVNSNPYTFGEQITIGDIVEVEVVDFTTLNLNIVR